MADGPMVSLSDLLHELAEGLQSTGTYLNAARRISSNNASEQASTANMISKAADELCAPTLLSIACATIYLSKALSMADHRQAELNTR